MFGSVNKHGHIIGSWMNSRQLTLLRAGRSSGLAILLADFSGGQRRQPARLLYSLPVGGAQIHY